MTAPTRNNQREVTPQVAAASLGISRPALMKQIARLEALGAARRDGRRWLVDLGALPGAWSAAVHPRARGAQVADTSEPLAARAESQARREAALAVMAELDLAQRRGELVKVEDVEREWFENGRMLRDRLEALPQRIAPLVAGTHEAQATLIDALREGIRDALNTAADAVSGAA